MKNKKEKVIEIPSLSLNAKVEQMAQFLRREARAQMQLSKRNLQVISLSKKTPYTGQANLIQQIAKRLRKEAKKMRMRKAA